MQEAVRLLLGRRSIRSYEEKQITDEQLHTVLEAGISAPSGMNDHKWKFIVFKRGGVMDAIIKEMDGDPFYGAPVVVAVFVDKASHTPVQDGSLAIGNMLNAAHMLGLGSCWINSMSLFFETDAGMELKEKYKIPSDYFCVGSCVLGYIRGNMPGSADRPGDIVVIAG
jgi:nitroreductase